MAFKLTVVADAVAFRNARRSLRRIRSPGYQRKAVRPAVSKTATVLNKSMKSRARTIGETKFVHERRGFVDLPAREMAKSIGVRRKTYSRTGWVVAAVGPRYAYRAADGSQPSAFAIFAEGLESSSALLSSPRAFAGPAVRQSMSAMHATFRREFVKGTRAVIAKLRGRGSTV